MEYTVYLRTNKVNGMQYVGQTCNFKQRENDWRCLKKSYANSHIDKDREIYGLDNFETAILAEVDIQEEAYKIEEMYIKELNTIYPNGYNICFGGKNNSGGGKRENNGFYGKHHSSESKRKLSESKKGIKHPMYGKKQSEETIRKKIIKISKAINQYDLEGNFIRRWASATEAGTTMKLCISHITKCCKGKRKTCGGYIWKHAEDC